MSFRAPNGFHEPQKTSRNASYFFRKAAHGLHSNNCEIENRFPNPNPRYRRLSSSSRDAVFCGVFRLVILIFEIVVVVIAVPCSVALSDGATDPTMTHLFGTLDIFGNDVREKQRAEDRERERIREQIEEDRKIEELRKANPELAALVDASIVEDGIAEQIAAQEAAEAAAAAARRNFVVAPPPHQPPPPPHLVPIVAPCAPATAKKPRASKPRRPRLPKSTSRGTSCAMSKEELCAFITHQIQTLAPPPQMVYQIPPMPATTMLPSVMTMMPLSPPQEVMTPLPTPMGISTMPLQMTPPVLDPVSLKQWHDETIVQPHMSEFDEEKRWVRPRKLDRRAPTIANVRTIEEKKGCLPGSVYVAVDWMRMCGVVNLHAEWLKKSKNTNSHYSRIQSELVNFFVRMRTSFETQFAEYVGQPDFNHMAYLRKKPERHSRKSQTTLVDDDDAEEMAADNGDAREAEGMPTDGQKGATTLKNTGGTRVRARDCVKLDLEEDTLYVRCPSMNTAHVTEQTPRAEDTAAAASYAEIYDDHALDYVDGQWPSHAEAALMIE
jgi:hypothetical protein